MAKGQGARIQPEYQGEPGRGSGPAEEGVTETKNERTNENGEAFGYESRRNGQKLSILLGDLLEIN